MPDLIAPLANLAKSFGVKLLAFHYQRFDHLRERHLIINVKVITRHKLKD